ncbi:hypothetical protein PHYPSEUDO_002110 [Phytophthora pseudosyringae]|uniref:Uncharacterized protein n=1 Tax=Phytophthora pseudosyringae TaxID=221518 RepID=A0A8T1VY22_9STRA|nr:hypothetical protein PHYPSEUDO_002110 [Phytophthora pseudosyringae]
MEARDTSGWHRKWVLLLGVLAWLFLYRYRVMGWLLSKAVTSQLSRNHDLACSAAIPLKKLVELHHAELHFSITDVEWSRFLPWGNGSVVPRTTGFDLSMLTERIHLAMERKLFESLFRAVPILQEAFDTKEPQTGETRDDNSEQARKLATSTWAC